jgi:hypothetical protein
MISPCLSAAGLRFWEHPVPAEDFRLAYAQPTGIVPDLIGITVSRMVEMRLGWTPSLLRGQRCPQVDSFGYQPRWMTTILHP